MKEGKATILGIETHYIETNGSSGSTIIILHGWGSSTKSWKAVARKLEANDRRVIIPDLPGFGQSAEPKQPWDVHDYVRFVREFTEYFSLNVFVLVGHSFGGQIALFFASEYPKKVKALVPMAAARIKGKRRRSRKVRLFALFSSIGNLIFILPFFAFLRPVVEKIWYRLTGEQDYYQSSQLMRETFKRVIDQEASNVIKRITTPTLIIWGREDDVTPLSDGKRLQQEIAGSHLYIVNNVGHDINIRMPEKITDALLGFIDRGISQ